ncbi:hypothetical protein MCERHM32_00123 [Methylophilaceae bacterium]
MRLVLPVFFNSELHLFAYDFIKLKDVKNQHRFELDFIGGQDWNRTNDNQDWLML